MNLQPRIEPIPGYTPLIGRLVGMLTYARSTTLAAVEGLTVAELDHLHDPSSNSIGALLAHIIVVERSYQALTFEGRPLSPDEHAHWSVALKLGAAGQQALRGRPLDHYLDELSAVREKTLAGLAARDDAWLEQSVNPAPRMNAPASPAMMRPTVASTSPVCFQLSRISTIRRKMSASDGNRNGGMTSAANCHNRARKMNGAATSPARRASDSIPFIS